MEPLIKKAATFKTVSFMIENCLSETKTKGLTGLNRKL
jgi:hypothetical protein